MKTEKMAALLAAAVLMGSIAAPLAVRAADAQPGNAVQETGQKEQKTELKAEVGSTYTLEIPAATTIVFGKTSTELNGVLKVSGNVDVGEKVTVTATPSALKNDSHGETLAYALMCGEDVFEAAQWSEAELRAGLEGDGKGKELRLSIAITDEAWRAAKAGKYEGSITFTAALNDTASPDDMAAPDDTAAPNDTASPDDTAALNNTAALNDKEENP